MAKKIAIVEDDNIIRQMLVDVMGNSGFDVVNAQNGVEGLELVLKEHPDLILLDVVMPRMDGLTMLKQLREDSWGKDVPVIILTNLGEVQDAEKMSQAIKGGVQDYLVKGDWKVEDVVGRVRARLGV